MVDDKKGNLPVLKHIRPTCKGWLYLDDKGQFAALVATEEKENGEIWIQALEIAKKYQGYGLSYKLLEKAHNNGAKFLSVNKKNEIAIKVYKNYGFKIYDETNTMYFMSVGKTLKKYINESKDASTIDKDFEKKSDKIFKYIDINSKEALKYITKDWINDKNAEIAICKKDNKLAGFVYINKSGSIGPLKVYEKYRGYCVGEELFKHAVEKYKGKKLGVYSDNEVAIKLYKKFGFVETGRKKYKDGDEVIIMEKKNR